MSELPVSSSGDDVHAHAARTGHRAVDLVLAISAITISIISLFVAVQHGRTERELVAANSWPFLIFTQDQRGNPILHRSVSEFRIENPGVGPANVKALEIRFDGKIVKDHAALLAMCCGYRSTGYLGDIAKGASSTNSPVGIIPARDKRVLLEWSETKANAPLFDKLANVGDRLSLRGCYCSVLGQCWTTDLRSTTTPRPVAECTSSPDTYRG